PLDLAVQVASALPFGNANAFRRNPGLTLDTSVLASRRFGQYMASAELGAVLRPPVVLADLAIHHELHAAVAAATTGNALRGEVGLRGNHYFGRLHDSAELFGGVRYAVNDQIELVSVASVGLLRSAGTPMFRILFGASFLEGTKVLALPPAP